MDILYVSVGVPALPDSISTVEQLMVWSFSLWIYVSVGVSARVFQLYQTLLVLPLLRRSPENIGKGAHGLAYIY